MKEFRVNLTNRPGELARVATALSRLGVSLKAVAATSDANQVAVHLVGHDVEATRSGLKSAGIPYQEQEVMVILMEDKPGELARVADRLSAAGINIDRHCTWPAARMTSSRWSSPPTTRRRRRRCWGSRRGGPHQALGSNTRIQTPPPAS